MKLSFYLHKNQSSLDIIQTDDINAFKNNHP